MKLKIIKKSFIGQFIPYYHYSCIAINQPLHSNNYVIEFFYYHCIANLLFFSSYLDMPLTNLVLVISLSFLLTLKCFIVTSIPRNLYPLTPIRCF